MRRLRLDQGTGIITPAKAQLHTASPIKMLRQPSQALRKIDRIAAGDSLRVCVNRCAGGIGDVLMTLPTVKAIKQYYNCKELVYVTDYDYLSGALPAVLQGNPYITQILDYREVSQEMKDEYDAYVDLCCPCTAHEVPHAEPVNRIDLFARHAGVYLTDHSINYYLTEKEVQWGEEFLLTNNIRQYKLIMVQAHSSTSRRDLPTTKLQHIVAKLIQNRKDVRVIVVTHDTDTSKSNWKLYGVTEMRNYSVRNIAAVMHHCELVLCQDSAILHLAGALNKKIVTFFGPTDPRARVNYFENAVAICPGLRLACFPCWYVGCSGLTCWKLIEEQLAVDTSLAMLDNTELPASSDLVYFGSSFKKQNGLLYEVL